MDLGWRKIISIGLAMFAMLFGAGNVVWPLVLGRGVGDKVWFGLLGFVLVGVIVPLIGLISTMLCDGEYKKLLERLGKIPAALITLVCMIMIGPFMGIPRCITLSYASISLYLPNFSLLWYTILSSLFILVCTIRKNKVMDLLGNYLGPLKLTLLLIIVIKGLFHPASFVSTDYTAWQGFLAGATNGSLTGDLLGTIFFSGLIFSGIKSNLGEDFSYKRLATFGLQSGIIGASLLGLVYMGFCLVAAFSGAQLAHVDRGSVFANLATLVLGSSGGLFANITIAVSCLTTALALTTVFATYVHRDIFQERCDYLIALVATILLGGILSNVGFEGIALFAEVVFGLIYPMLMMLAVTNFIYVLTDVKCIKLPVLVTFLVTLYIRYGESILKLLY